jgi:membrane protein DedA with SNARE-associated domain/membrane-associated phospholipid phosphatase
VTQHPNWVAIAVFAVALTESLVLVGLIVPGAVLMITAGALISTGGVGFWSILLAAIAGAIAGDGISYWIGHHYRDQLKVLWPFSRHPQWLARGETFFHRHGGKSILFGRFVGPVRPFVPVVAGMLGMRPAKFYKVNVLSALIWAPAYLLPGMAFGTSLALAGEVAARLALLLLLLVGLIWLASWLILGLFRVLSPRAGQMTQNLLSWARQHPRSGKLIRGLLDPSQPELRTLLTLALLLFGALWLFLGVLEDVVTGDPLVYVDQGLYQFLQDLRTPWGDRLMVIVTELGDSVVIALVAAAVLAWLVWRRNWHAAWYWGAAVGFGQLAASLIKLVLQRPRPITDIYNGISSYSFPSGHATMSMVVYGFLAVLIARHLSSSYRWIVYALAALLISSISISRLYLGAHWLSDVLGGLSLGLAWVSLLGIAYVRHPSPEPLPRSLPGVAILVLVLAGGLHVNNQYSADLQRYAPQLKIQHLQASAWWQDDWRLLPSYRQDLEGKLDQPLNVQWSGTLASVRETLYSQGWREPVSLNATTAMRWLLPDPSLAELPVLPQVHDGRHEALLMLGPSEQGREPLDTNNNDNQQLTLRFWKSGMVLDSGTDSVPIWIGSARFQQLRRILILRLPVTAHGFDQPLQQLTRSLSDIEQRVVRLPRNTAESEPDWSGSLVLIRN